jgi:hypothetical protein
MFSVLHMVPESTCGNIRLGVSTVTMIRIVVILRNNILIFGPFGDSIGAGFGLVPPSSGRSVIVIVNFTVAV